MKKLINALLILMLAATAALLMSCGGNGSDETGAVTTDGTQQTASGENLPSAQTTAAKLDITDITTDSPLSDIMTAISDGIVIDCEVEHPAVTAENFEWYYFIPQPEGVEAYVSEAVSKIVPHSICLLRVNEDDAESIRAEIEENLSPYKWNSGDVSIEPESYTVFSNGNLVLVTMTTNAIAGPLVENFLSIIK